VLRIKILMALFVLISLSIFSLPTQAGDVVIVKVELRNNTGGDNWTFHVTLKHADSGWNHYADAWRIVTEDGTVLGKRVLFHPHENEQPFTRSLSDVKLGGNAIIYVEAHDKVHGWNKDKVKIDFDFKQGDRYTIVSYSRN